ncbi:hypothetical protein [Achromobacter kerstersii]|jgi:hypothetical protein
MEIWKDLQDQLERYCSISSAIHIYLNAYEGECSVLIEKISSCSSFEEAQEYFDALHEIQRRLSTARYKFKFPLNDRLRDLTYYLDRDDVYSRRHWYEEFKKGLKWPVE